MVLASRIREATRPSATPSFCFFSDEERAGIGMAFNEATLLGIEVDAAARTVAVTFWVFSLPPDGPAPSDPRVLFLLSPAGRVAARLLPGRWDGASLEPFEVEQLLEVVQSFQGGRVYGKEFLDLPEEPESSAQLSLDWRSGDVGLSHTLTLFQDGKSRRLDVRIWFDTLTIYDSSWTAIPLEKFIANGKRWWDGFFRDDPRTAGSGMYRLRGSGETRQ
jgi:hypothetical protein